MDRFLVFFVICSLGGACAGVVRRDTAGAVQQIDSTKGLADLASQYMALAYQYQASQTAANGGQPASDPTNGAGAAIQSAFRGLFLNTGDDSNYDLSAAMQSLNLTYGIPTIDTTDTSSMTREQFLEHVQKQANTFSNLNNAKMTLWLEPTRVAKFLNLTNQYYDPSIANNTEAQAALQREYQNFMIDFEKDLQEKLNGEKTRAAAADPVSSSALMEGLQRQMTDMAAMYNAELSRALKPEDVQGALTGNEMDNTVANLGNAVMTIFQKISQKPGPFNSQLHWDSNKLN